jgi:hypothetical protein
MIAAAVASCEEAVPYSALQPYGEHFHPIPSALMLAREKVKQDKLMARKMGTPFVAVNITPLEYQVCGVLLFFGCS